MKKKMFFLFSLLLTLGLTAQKVYRTTTFDSKIKTLQIYPEDEPLAMPVIQLGGSEHLNVSFDEMSHEIRSYSYRVFHCNADWTKNESLIESEYIRGFSRAIIEDYKLSVNTSFLYTNYRFSFPNDELSFTKSGNYVLQIYEDDKVDEPVAQACFSIVEPKVEITGKIRGNTDTEINKSLQQIDFDVDLKGQGVRNPQEEIKVVVRQNNRIDNERRDLKPSYFQRDILNFINNKDLIFEGGNEYYQFDISSLYSGSNRVEQIKFNRPHYDAFLYDDIVNKSGIYLFEQDANGGYIINLQESHFDTDTEADYIFVHFSIPKMEPFFDGQIYIGGNWNNNLLNEESRMQYDFNSGRYFKTLLLKQGGYNYQYWFLPKGKTKASVERVSGSFWQTRNEYSVYVYHREWGGRYDKLIGLKVL